MLSVYSESHISYLYISIYYIEIIWVLYFQLNSELTILIFLKKDCYINSVVFLAYQIEIH